MRRDYLRLKVRAPLSRNSRLLAAVILVMGTLKGIAAFPSETPLGELRGRADHASSSTVRIEALWALADAQADRGLMNDAERTLRAAAAQSMTDEQKSQTVMRLAAVLTASGRTDEAAAELSAAERLVTTQSPEQRARLSEIKGSLAARTGDLVGAERAFESAAAAAHSVGPAAVSVEVRDRINALRARIDRKEISGLEDRLQALAELTRSLPSSDENAMSKLALGELFARAVREFRSPVELRSTAFDLYTHARDEATSVATRAYAAGLMGALYEDEGRAAEASRLTLQAISLSQSINAEDQLYRWEWQLSRLQRAGEEASAAEASIDRALFTLAAIRSDVLQSSRQAFASQIEPIYLAYADEHLRQAAGLPDGSPEQQKVLRDVRDQLESLKQAEVQDYFDNGCVTSNARANQGINIPGTAVVYPIMLTGRTEVLIETGGVLRRFSQPVSRGQLTATVRRMRLGLEQPSAGEAYRQPAQQLYQWLLADAADWLKAQQVNTLVFVPSGALRTIPPAALLDGDTFLIQRFAIATTPAITLIASQPVPHSDHVLLAGLTQSVQGFAGLPSVSTEIHSIGAIFQNKSLQDQTFSLTAIRSDLSQPGFSIAHLATHGEFSADHRQSFVLTYDDRLTMDGLQLALAKRQDPLDLLVLSACSTAAGDDRAALGLAGVAIEAGAKSALASLWSISDEATASLMSSFYRSLKTGGQTKAQSLREAQIALLDTQQYRHPSYWAPYLMIGDWM